MAFQRIGKVNYPITCNLSVKSIEDTKNAIMQTQEDLIAKCDEFCKRLAEQGVILARDRIEFYHAKDTGRLYNSIDMKPGDAVTNGASWLVYTDCDYAEFIEFGTGSIGQQNPHPSGKGWYNQDLSNKVPNPYNPNDKTLGWWFGHTWTPGQPSRPFMWDTWNELQKDSIIKQIAKEVFG